MQKKTQNFVPKKMNGTKRCKLEKEEDSEKNPSFFIEKKGNLFSSSNSLAHCISKDLKLGAGIAKTFRSKYEPELIQFLTNSKVKTGKAYAFLNEDRFIYNLVTKDKFYEKPTYLDLRKSLENMKKHAVLNKITEISMPKIGCGLDKLEWEKVKFIICEVFWDSGIEITVYYFD